MSDCQKISSRKETEAKIPEYKVTNSILKNWIFGLKTLLANNQPKNDFLKKIFKDTILP